MSELCYLEGKLDGVLRVSRLSDQVQANHVLTEVYGPRPVLYTTISRQCLMQSIRDHKGQV